MLLQRTGLISPARRVLLLSAALPLRQIGLVAVPNLTSASRQSNRPRRMRKYTGVENRGGAVKRKHRHPLVSRRVIIPRNVIIALIARIISLSCRISRPLLVLALVARVPRCRDSPSALRVISDRSLNSSTVKPAVLVVGSPTSIPKSQILKPVREIRN